MENRSTPTEAHAEAILNAAGSSLRNYTMPATREAILAAVQAVYSEGYLAGSKASDECWRGIKGVRP